MRFFNKVHWLFPIIRYYNVTTVGMLLNAFFARLILSLVISRLNLIVQMNVQVHTASGGYSQQGGPLRAPGLHNYVPGPNFKACRFAYRGGSHVAVGIISLLFLQLFLLLSQLQPIFTSFVSISFVS